MPGTRVNVTLPEGVALVDGDVTDTVDLLPADTVNLLFTLVCEREGAFRIDAVISPEVPDSLHWIEHANCYAISAADSAIVSDTLLSGCVFTAYGDNPRIFC